MNIKKYNMLINTIELGSITKAAQKTGVSQSAATQLLASLEKDFQVKLIKRSKSGVTLTKEGAYLLPMIKDVAEANEKLAEAVEKLHNDKTVIRIATFKSVAVNWLPAIIKEYHHRFPNIRIELIDAGYNDIEKVLSDKSIDIGFIPLPAGKKYKAVSVYQDRLLAVFPEGYENLPVQDRCPVSIFGTEPVIALSESIDRDSQSVYSTNNIVPNICYRVEDDYALLAMIEKGLGISIVPELILRGTDHHVKIMELDPPAFRTIGIAFPSEDNPRNEVTDFYKFIIEFVNNLRVRA